MQQSRDAMVTNTYGGAASAYDTDTSHTAMQTGSYRSAGELIFLWIAWTLAFAFWAFTMSTFFGIFREIGAGAPGAITGPDAGGVSYLMLAVIAFAVLGAGLAWGMARDKGRDRRLDATTEASTAAMYEEGGSPMQRDSYRPV